MTEAEDEPEVVEGEVVENEGGGSTKSSCIGTAFGFLILIAALVGIVLLAIALLPDKAPIEKNPHWIDLIFDSRWVIWVTRLTGLVALSMFLVFAVYFIGSVIYRIRHGHWLRSGGPFEAEIAERVEGAIGEAQEQLQLSLEEAELRASALEQELRDTNELLEHISNLAEAAFGENQQLREQLEQLGAEEAPERG